MILIMIGIGSGNGAGDTVMPMLVTMLVSWLVQIPLLPFFCRELLLSVSMEFGGQSWSA